MTTHNISDWVSELCDTIGIGELNLIGAKSGYATFANSFTVGDTIYYALIDGQDKESGIGTLIDSSTIQRTTVISTIKNGVLNITNPVKILLSGNAIVSCSVTARTIHDKEDNWGNPGGDGYILVRDIDGTTVWTDPVGISSVIGFNILGSDTTDNIKLKDSAEVGKAWIATTVGTDSNGSPVAVDDVLVASVIGSPAMWVTIGPVANTTFSSDSFSVFDTADSTRNIIFNANAIQSGASRSIKMTNYDVDLRDIQDIMSSVLSDSGIVIGWDLINQIGGPVYSQLIYQKLTTLIKVDITRNVESLPETLVISADYGAGYSVYKTAVFTWLGTPKYISSIVWS